MRFGNVRLPMRLRRLMFPTRLIALGLVMVILLLTAVGCGRVREADSEYEQALEQIEEIQSLLDEGEFYTLTADDMAWLESEFVILAERVDNIKRLSELPFGLDNLLGDAERGSPRFRAVLQTLEVAQLLAESGQVVANIGQEALVALDTNGIRYDATDEGDTWLEVLQRRDAELYGALDIVDEALAMREDIEEEELPHRVKNVLEKIDVMSERFSSQRELANELPVAFQALGADHPVRYLALFQNPAEMRPTGGFIGTAAIVEIERGQLVEYEFLDVYDLSQAYAANVEDPYEPPMGISRFVRADFLQYQDANWWPHFPTTAELMMEMTEIAGWGDIDGVVAIQPEAVSNLIAITGTVDVDVDGETRTITAENLHEEAERQRRLSREGEIPETGHKEVISLIGEAILDHISEGDRDDLIDTAFLMFDALDQRDMQVYHRALDAQRFLEERNWAGLLQPEPETPTIAAILSNITGLKTSLAMQAEIDVELDEPDPAGTREAVFTITLNHIGDAEEDDFYEGFQRWWIDIVIPDEAELLDHSPSHTPDPDASSGGAYVIELDVGERSAITVRFSMEDDDRLLLRRQPGLLDVPVSITHQGCGSPIDTVLTEDIVLLLESGCPVIEVDEEDGFSGRN
jgi:hypothetical protein